MEFKFPIFDVTMTACCYKYEIQVFKMISSDENALVKR